MSDRITTIRSSEGIAAIHDRWLDFEPGDANADPAVLRVLLDTREDVDRPHVVVAETAAGGAILAGRIEHTTLAVRLGYLSLYAPRVRALTVAQGGAIGDAAALGAALDAAREALRDGDADVLRLRALPVGSAAHRLAKARGTWATRGRTAKPAPRWRLRLPESLDEILALHSKKARGNELRSARKLEEAFEGRLSFDVYRDPSDLPTVLRECAEVSEKTYQRALGAGFAPGEEERRLLELAAARGWLRAYVLTAGDEPRAFWIGNVYGGVFYSGPTGYDPALSHLRPGAYLALRMLDDLCRDPNVDEVDWGPGDGGYKRFFSTHGWLEEDVLLFAPTLRGVRLNLTRSALLATAAATRALAERVPALGGVKRRWRDRLAGRGGAPPRRQPRRPLRLPGGARLAALAALLPAVLLGAVLASAALDRPATTLHGEITVNAPRSVVWRLLTEFEDYDTWNPYITRADGSARTGGEVDLLLAHGETAVSVECDVITVKHLRKLYWRCRDHAMPGLLDREHVFRLLPVAPDGKQVRIVYDGRWEGVLVPLTQLGHRKAGYGRMILALKQRAEQLVEG